MSLTLPEALQIIELQQGQIAELIRMNQIAQQENAELKHQIEGLNRKLYGTRSERFEPNQFFMDGILKEAQTEAPSTPDVVIPVKGSERKKARPHGRAIIPDDIPREEVVLDLPEDKKVDPATGQPLVKLREEISEKVAWKPGDWYVIRYVRPIYVHPDRQNDTGVISALMPDSPIEKCKADPSVLALIAIQKWADHLPLYRQREIFKRGGIDLASSTVDAWAVEPILACEPLYEALKRDVLSRGYLFTDDTPVRLQVIGLGKTKSARMWVYVSGTGPPHQFFDFTEDRCKERPGDILTSYRGFVQADAYSGYDHLFLNPAIMEVGCWAHLRRKFDEAKTSSLRECVEMLTRIGQLYDIERTIKDLSPEERKARRQAEALPLMAPFFEQVAAMAKAALPSSPLGKALTYATNQCKALQVYLTDGRLEIDNNTAERAIRPLALGRKNWLFAGSQRGGKACAIALSLIHSAKAVDINPYDYLLDVYRRIMSHPINHLDELLPAQWKAARQSS